MDANNWVDLHCHFLPAMDDGCKDEDESCRLLEAQLAQGVHGVAATPHYYPRESVQKFLDRRTASYERLQNALEERKMDAPEICLGAEVAFRDGISMEAELRKLCYGNSNYLLLEMPFQKWEGHVLREVERIRLVQGIIPVIAHFERYMKYQDRRLLSTLYDLDVRIQMNAENYLDFWARGKAKKLIRDGVVQVLGSDAHNLERRKPNLMEGVQKMRADGLTVQLDEMKRMGCEIFTKAVKQ